MGINSYMNRITAKVCNLFPFLCGCFIQFNKMSQKGRSWYVKEKSFCLESAVKREYD